MNLLKEKLNPNSEYNKKLRRYGIAMVKEMYKEAIECLEDCIKNQPYKCRNEMRLAIEALEKQMPKDVIFVHPLQKDDGGDYICPSCETGTVYDAYGKRSSYCPYCGQALNWE